MDKNFLYNELENKLILDKNGNGKYYEIKIDDYYFIMQHWNKYRGDSYFDFTIYVSKYPYSILEARRGKQRFETYTENYPCYWLNYEKGMFTNYFLSGRHQTQATKYTNYEDLLGKGKTHKDFYKLQKKYNKIINKKLIMRFQLDEELPINNTNKEKRMKL